MKSFPNGSKAPSLVLLLLLLVNCSTGFSNTNATEDRDFELSTSSLSPSEATTTTSTLATENVPSTTHFKPLIKLVSIDLTRNSTTTSTSQITSFSRVTSSTATEASSLSLLASPSSSPSSSLTDSPITDDSNNTVDTSSSNMMHTTAIDGTTSLAPLEARDSNSNQPEFEEENTDERPPASSSLAEPESSAPTTQEKLFVDPATTPGSDPGPIRTMNQTVEPLSTIAATHEALINDVHVEKKLKNGLYRIKLAEIITDQFNGGINQQLDDTRDNDMPPMMKMNHRSNKINIADLYPLKREDLNPVIRNSNEQFTREKSVYFKDSASTTAPTASTKPVATSNSLRKEKNDDLNVLTNSLDDLFQAVGESIRRRADTKNPSINRHEGDETDFTGKLLQEKDGVITEIEKKFRLDEFEHAAAKATVAPKPLNRHIEFIDRRVKKSFDFPMHHAADTPRVGFANTKFNSDTGKFETGLRNPVGAPHPEFSTTKFYNSKEFHSEPLQKTRSPASVPSQNPSPSTITTTATTTITPVTSTSTKTELITKPELTAALPNTAAPTTLNARTNPSKHVRVLPEQSTATQESPVSLGVRIPPRGSTTTEKESTDLNTVTTMSSGDVPVTSTTNVREKDDTIVSTSSAWQQSFTTQIANNRSTTSTKKSKTKPLSRPRVLSRLQEKINSLECDILNLPLDAHMWRGNETHELMLPIVTPENCRSSDCTPMLISWEGEAEIQSGDVLLVEINDSMLYPNYQNRMSSGHTTQVYQVTRSGHEHCDVTEGILLDITPLVVDGRKLVTLYDKDLTEGINLLIVVSELWGSQCIRLKVTMKSDNCGDSADCSGKGVCFSNDSMEGYECQCCTGFAGSHCEEIDACSPSPCTNNGICLDLSQGHEGNSYQCLCPYGYTGKNCQYESDPCNPAECLNGGSCVGNSSHFRCDCAPGYAGPLCQHNLNECESSPCVHGICVDQEDGFRCFCQPGFAGELCNYEYNECESNPCLNGAECIDQIGSFECRCSKGYIGSRCEIKVDFCANKPCPEGHQCIDHGDDFSCECPGGRNGPDCNQVPRTQCNVNPCTHGGTCWSSGDSFYCACRPGYTGTMCEDEFVVETVVSSSEFMVDDTSTRNFNDKAFGAVVLKTPIELHNAYMAAGVLAAAIFIVAVVVTICHCKVNQTYRKFSTRSTAFFPILGFGRRKAQKSHKHWLSGKAGATSNPLKSGRGHIPGSGSHQFNNQSTTGLHQATQQIPERSFQRHLAMNLENDMYYTVDFSEHSQHSPLIQ